MPRKPGLSRRQHVDLGAQLQAARDTLVHALTLIGNAYPHTSKATRLAEKASKAVDALRCELDDVSARELPGDRWSPLIYYGARDVARQEWLAANPLEDEETR